jgi:hypothetical protein
MNGWVRQQMSGLHEHFANESHFNQLILINGFLFMLSLPILLFAPMSLLHKIWTGIFFGTFFIDHLWRNRYPALKRWIAGKEYRRQAVALYERFCHASRPEKMYSIGTSLMLVFFLPMAALAPHSLLPAMVVLCIGYSLCTLAFIDEVYHEWYPALKQKPGMMYVFLAMNFLVGIPAYASAYGYINRVTGVDPGNFTYALGIFTAVAMVPAWTMTIAIMAAVIMMASMMALPVLNILSRWGIIDLWYRIRNLPRVRSVLSLPLVEKRELITTRFVGRICGAFGVLALCGFLLIGLPPVNRAVHVLATTVLVGTQFSYDRTCTVSNEHRRVAYLKDRKEMKASIVSIADVHSWPDISFSTGTCDNAIQP